MLPLAFLTAVPGWALMLMAALGTGYTLAAAWVFRARYRTAYVPGAVPRSNAAVTLLKPLYGAEPRLVENLATFLEQDHDGPVQVLCGVQRADDPAILAVHELKVRYPDARIDLVIDSTRHGASGKISNLCNMIGSAEHDILILSDSDMAADRDYLARVVAALEAPGVGAVSCLYRGHGEAGFWSRFGAAGIAWQFLPSAAFGVAMGLARPCMGSTIAMHRAVLDSIGGFARFADILADDYAIGEAVWAQGREVAVLGPIVTHGSAEGGLGELWRHELRWGATVRGVVPAAYVSNVMSMPLPLALGAAAFHPAVGLAMVAIACAARFLLAATVDDATGLAPAPLWLLPWRDLFGFAVFVASFFTRKIDWRGNHLRLGAGSGLTTLTETAPQ
ncbi:bacteriohopanetetrol glucosamine biosynthesis glycosyltransferase HpnI [Novosphingobium nitrogenifigens]|uniref:bacteriohopanetetrol glucosamine biosynthesis glycosyltransferase HpnI n=1 Tax=Novosphingobium nitrogenifigens TaxID=378548 RepID=UPI000561E44D|nr:bacteriohopanetetrol glucosamine biosynthesis glycosyltransferase HpnI [Novosphingobium nitrogenifigens]